MFRLVNRIERDVLQPFSLFLFSVSGLVMFVEAIQRTLFSTSFEWSSEISVYSMIWAILLMIANAGKQGHHIRMEMLISMLPSPLKKRVLLTVHLLSLIYSAIFLYSSIQMVKHAYLSKQLSQSTLQLPIWMLSIVMILAGILLCFYYLEFLVVEWKRTQPRGTVEPLLRDTTQGGV